ncbi:MAG: hypothetical protein JWN66_1321 [Sphingomonas bacterium]|nr:hypothetical protein [Sphingomonas bacterium]
MPAWKCFIRGTGFPVGPMGNPGPYGFYTTRWVQALNRRKAETKALALLRKDPSFDKPKRRFSWSRRPDLSAARVHFERIDRIAFLPRRRGGGATWFPEDAVSNYAGPAARVRERLADRGAGR